MFPPGRRAWTQVHITGQQGSLRTFLCCAVVLLVHFELALEQRKTLGNQRREHEPSSYGTKSLYFHAQTQRNGRFQGFPTVLLYRKQRESKNLKPSLPTSIVQALTHSNIHRYFYVEPLSLKCMLHIPKYPTYDLMGAHLNISHSFKTKSNSNQPAILESLSFFLVNEVGCGQVRWSPQPFKSSKQADSLSSVGLTLLLLTEVHS